jgi:GT2 family glycosyltransferase
LLSIVIVAYKSEKEIVGCLASIRAISFYDEIEIIIVENPALEENIDSNFLLFKNEKIIRVPENVGFAKANNIGLNEANGLFILILNPDTIVNESAILACIEQAKLREIGFVTPRLMQKNGQMDLACRRKIPTVWDGFCRAVGLSLFFPKVRLFSGYNLTYLDDYGRYPVDAVNGAFMLIERNKLLKIGFFDEAFFMYGDDLDLCYRALLLGFKNFYIGDEEVIHIKGASSSKEPKKMLREVFVGTGKFYKKHFNPGKFIVIDIFYDLLFFAWKTLAQFIQIFNRNKSARP